MSQPPPPVIVPMTDEELADVSRRRRRRYALVAAIALVIAVVAGVVITRVIQVGLGRTSPLADVTQFSNSLPLQIVPEAALTHLDRESKTDWHLRYWGTYVGGETKGGVRRGVQLLDRDVDLPPVAKGKKPGLVTIYSNLADTESVSANGSLAMLQFSRWAVARDYLMGEPRVFLDDDVEAGRDTYLVGSVVLAYSPIGAQHDRTPQLRKFLPYFVQCAKVVRGCEPPAPMLDFSDWAPRAVDE